MSTTSSSNHGHTSWLGISVILLSAITYSMKAIFVKLAFRYGVDPITLLSFRMMFSAPFFAAILLFDKRPKSNLTLNDILGITAMGILGFYLSSLLDFIGLQYISAALERMILFTYPTMVLFLSSFLLGKPIKQHQIYAVIITYLGLLIVFWSEFMTVQKDIIRGSLFVFGCAITFAFYYLGSEKLIPRFGSLRYTSLTLIVTTIFVVLHTLLTPVTMPIHPQVILISVFLAIISTVIPTLLLSIGIQMVGASTSAIVSTIGPIATIVLANIILGEHLNLIQCIGGLIVICGILLLRKKRAVINPETS